MASPLAVAEKERTWFPGSPRYNAALCSRAAEQGSGDKDGGLLASAVVPSDHVHVPLRLGGLDNRQL